MSWFQDCMQHLVVNKFGEEKWNEIVERFRLSCGSEIRPCCTSTLLLLNATVEVLRIDVEKLRSILVPQLTEFASSIGFRQNIADKEPSLRTWLQDVDKCQNHILAFCLSDEAKCTFFCSDYSADGSYVLRYVSKYGILLSPLVVSIVKTVAIYHFDAEVELKLFKTALAAEGLSLSWRITPILTHPQPATLPCTSRNLGPYPNNQCFSPLAQRFYLEEIKSFHSLPRRHILGFVSSKNELTTIETEQHHQGHPSCATKSTCKTESISISAGTSKEMFPYHIVTSHDFQIRQVGFRLPNLLKIAEADLIGTNVDKILQITEPVHVAWEWKSLRKVEDQAFYIEYRKDKKRSIKLRVTMVQLSTNPLRVMFILSPDAKRASDLRKMNLTLNDLPPYTFQREAVVKRDECAYDVLIAHKLDVLTKKLQHEQLLAGGLLRTLVPSHVMALLKDGKPVTPEYHDSVTMVFTDIAGYEAICDEVIHPPQIIQMLNRLHCVLEFLSKKFNVFQVEMKGDEFFGCCGLLANDTMHAVNVANFAIAARHCARHVQSPVDGAPIQLRIGIHTGQCMSGVVGMSCPRFKVFGDTVNTASRHKSTCYPGRIQCSTQAAIAIDGEDRLFIVNQRGFVVMKGKGRMFTYWLQNGAEKNRSIDSEALGQLDNEVAELLRRETFIQNKDCLQHGLSKRGWSESGLVENSLLLA